MYSHIYLCKCIRDSQYFPNHSGSSYEADINVLKTTGYEAWRYPCTGSRIYFVYTSATYSGVHHAIIDTRPSKSEVPPLPKFSYRRVTGGVWKLNRKNAPITIDAPNLILGSKHGSKVSFYLHVPCHHARVNLSTHRGTNVPGALWASVLVPFRTRSIPTAVGSRKYKSPGTRPMDYQW